MERKKEKNFFSFYFFKLITQQKKKNNKQYLAVAQCRDEFLLDEIPLHLFN